MVPIRLLFAFLWLVVRANVEESVDQLIDRVSSKTTSPKQFAESLYSLEALESDPRISKLLGKTYFFGRRNVLKPNYRKAFDQFSSLNDAESFYMTSLCYTLGLGVSRSTEKALIYLRFAAKEGSESAQLALGYRYAAGIGLTRSCPKARDYYYASAKKTAKIHEVERHVSIPKARLLTEKKNVRSSQMELVEYYEYSADKDQPATLQLLGQIFYEGYNETPVDYVQARSYFEQAAEQGAVASKGYLGEIYLHGLGVERDTSKAFSYFREAAQAGSTIGNNGLGVLYRDGIEVLADEEEALALFIKAADEGNAEAQYNAGTLMHKLHPQTHDDKSLAYLVQAFQQGHTLAQFEIARRNVHNNLVCSFCLTLLRGVVERGPEMLLFEEAFDDFHDGDLEVALAKYFFLADHGYEAAQENAAHILVSSGLESGYRRALVYLHRSANQGNVETRIKLGDLFYAGKGIPSPDLLTAYLAYKEAFGRNSPQASFNLGYMYQHGLGIPKDLYLARRYYDAAAMMDVKKMPEAWFPVKLALITLGIEEYRETLASFKTYIPHMVTLVLLLVAAPFALRRLVPRPNRQ